MLWSTYMTGHFRNLAFVDELTKKATLVSEELSQLEAGALTGDAFNHFMQRSPDMLNTGIVLDLNKDVSWQRVRQPSSDLWSKEDLKQAEQFTAEYRANIASEQTVVFSAPLGSLQETVIFVGVPIYYSLGNSTQPAIIGGAYVFQEVPKQDIASFTLLLPFLAALCLTLVMMAFPTLYFINLMVKPLFKIRDVAKSISEGDFSHRANETYKAEFGELSSAINQMSDHLQQTIRDLETESIRLQQVLNGLNEGILAYTVKQKLTHMNPTFRNYFPECKDSIIRESLQELPNEEIRRYFNQALESGETQYLTLTNEGQTIFGQILILETSEGILQGVVGLFRDITEESRLEQTRRDYVSNVSHELKTPLTAMSCMIEPMLDGLITKPEDLSRYYQIIYDETLRMSRLIDDMLELSRLQSGRTLIELEPFYLDSLLDNLYAKFSGITRELEIDFTLEKEQNPLPMVYANPDRVEQTIYIFLDNAKKFTPAHGKITLSAAVTAEKVILSVADTGKGISREDQKHIFDRFYKADKSHGSQGTGLGLSIAKEITELTGERVWVESIEGQGSTFYLTIARHHQQ